MAKLYRTAMGSSIDMDMLRLANETTIAVGNMKTNARGDELGAGGKILRTRAQIMQDYHKLNTSVPVDQPVNVATAAPGQQVPIDVLQSIPSDTPVTGATTTPEYVKPRGSFAEAVASETEVNQELLQPAALRNPTGINRI